MKIICISASNILKSKDQSISLKICEIITKILEEKSIISQIIDLREYNLSPCIGCGKCFESRRCSLDNSFNDIYEEIVSSDGIFFVSPHYAPIPAKLSMLLEKMEQITFLHWWKDNTYKSEVSGLPAGIISHGGGAEWALKSYKAMVNDTIANAIDTIQCKLVPYSKEWNTGISLPVENVQEENSIFPIQSYDWIKIEKHVRDYVEIFMTDNQ